MFSIILAQDDTQILQNLVDSEKELQALDSQVLQLQDQYAEAVADAYQYSFFNFSNIYFWLVLVGLILLAVGLLFLLVDLRYYRPVTKITPAKPLPVEPVKTVVADTAPKPKAATAKALKIKVQKVK